ncbi:MAG: hypothetical protein EA369_05075 [Bradymonadales bacterium]|nr:MAG: hypothetical protein EA369_05075 [Bradymonadales bacterium]
MKNNQLFHIKTGQDLANDFHAIGANFAADEKRTDPNIEATLVSASIEGIHMDDHRFRGVLVDWIDAHSLRINVESLTRLVRQLPEKEYKFVLIFWSAIAQRLANSDPRFRRLAGLYKGKRLDFLDRNMKGEEKRITDMFIDLKGLDERFEGTCIRAPKNAFPHRPSQIFKAASIAKTHMPFRYRTMMGASFRADVWALLRRKPDTTAYQLAKLVGCSTTTALRVKHDYEILKRDYSNRSRAA